VSKAKILVIDDEPGIINLVSAYLGREGYEVYTATDGPGGLQTAHPASVTVSVATRKAIDANSIRDIPRHSKQAKLEALRQIDRRFHELTEVAKHLASQESLVFSVYLTESNHWTRFSYAHNHWVVEVHQPPVSPSEVVVVLSDTALLNLLDKALKMRDAQALGHIAGDPRAVIQIAAVVSLGQAPDPRGQCFGRAEPPSHVAHILAIHCAHDLVGDLRETLGIVYGVADHHAASFSFLAFLWISPLTI